MTAGLHAQLLIQARYLAHKEPKRPLQASVRRAASAAYYGLFHFLIDEAARDLIGARSEDRTLRDALARAFEHGQMNEAAKRFMKSPRDLPDSLQRCFAPGAVFSGDLQLVAQCFSELQDMRETADYDRGIRFSRREAERAVWLAQHATLAWARIRRTLEARVFLVSLLAWRGLRGR